MINKKVTDALNEQINAEMWSAYLYLSMSAYFQSNNLAGFANWMRIQYQEEMSHALKFFDYVTERGGKVELKPIAEVKTEWKNAIEVFKETLVHEQKVTSLINNLVNIAIEEKDHASNNFLQWYVSEQVEEESNVDKLLGELILVDGNGHGMLLLDRELATRVFIDPTKTI